MTTTRSPILEEYDRPYETSATRPQTPDGLRRTVEELLALADIRIDGDRPWDLRVLHPDLYRRVLAQGSLGLGESHMDGWWDCEALDEWSFRIFHSRLDQRARPNLGTLWAVLRSRLLNLQSLRRAKPAGAMPYRFGDDLFEAMLDPRMAYSCGYWAEAETLDAAQEAKLDLVCRKIGLEPGQRVLDIGCGWGSFAIFAAERYGAEVVGITVSPDQAELARQRAAGLPVEIRLQDYRELAPDETFDHIVSIGMFEHVGFKNYRTFFEQTRRHLRDDGLFLLHTIGRNHSVTTLDPWVDKYVFPNCMLPSARQIAGALEGVFVTEDWHNFSADYDRTLMAWWHNFDTAWADLEAAYGERFYRMWRFYLQGCAGRFRARRNQLWQLVLSKHGMLGGWRSVR